MKSVNGSKIIRRVVPILLSLAVLTGLFPAAASATDSIEEAFSDVGYVQEADEEDPNSEDGDILLGRPFYDPVDMIVRQIMKHPLLLIPIIPVAAIATVIGVIEEFFLILADFFVNPGDYIPIFNSDAA